jgi:hypothetical protein
VASPLTFEARDVGLSAGQDEVCAATTAAAAAAFEVETVSVCGLNFCDAHPDTTVMATAAAARAPAPTA